LKIPQTSFFKNLFPTPTMDIVVVDKTLDTPKVPTTIRFGAPPSQEFSINWERARKHSKYLARFQDDAKFPTHLFEDHPAKAFQSENFRQVWAVVNGVGWTVPYNRYWMQLLQVDFYVLVRGFRVDDDGGGSPSESYNHVFKNPSPDRMLLLEKWWKLNQQGIMYSRNDPEDEQPNDDIDEDMEALLRDTPTVVGTLASYPRFVLKINFLRTNW